jgi:hypothetical protein
MANNNMFCYRADPLRLASLPTLLVSRIGRTTTEPLYTTEALSPPP